MPEVRQAEAWNTALSEDLEECLADGRAFAAQDILEQCDAWLLAEIKETLSEGLRAFEQHGARLRQLGAASLRDSCQHSARLVEFYHQRLASALFKIFERVEAGPESGAALESRDKDVQRLHSGTYWLLEEEPGQRLAVLQRTPLALSSLAALQEAPDAGHVQREQRLQVRLGRELTTAQK
jgi:hypothetical protein